MQTKLIFLAAFIFSFASAIHGSAVTDGEIIPFPYLNPYSLAQHEAERADKQMPSLRADQMPKNGWMISVISKNGTSNIGIFVEGRTTVTGVTEVKMRMLQPDGQFSRQLQYAVSDRFEQSHGKLSAGHNLEPGTNVSCVDRNLVRFGGRVKQEFTNGIVLVEHQTQTGEVWYHGWPNTYLRSGQYAVENAPAYGPSWESIETFKDFVSRAKGPSRPVTGFEKNVPSPGQLVLIHETYWDDNERTEKTSYVVTLFEKELGNGISRAKPFRLNGTFDKPVDIWLASNKPYVSMVSEKDGFKPGDQVSGKNSRDEDFEGVIAVIFENGISLIEMRDTYRYSRLSTLNKILTD